MAVYVAIVHARLPWRRRGWQHASEDVSVVVEPVEMLAQDVGSTADSCSVCFEKPMRDP